MGWEERDWAKWTDEERARYLGSSTRVGGAVVPAQLELGYDARHEPRRREVVLLAMVLSLGASLASWHFHLLHFAATPAPATQLTTPSTPAVAPIVYGTGLSHLNGQAQGMTCTAMASTAQGSEYCTTWTLLQPGQQVVQAAALAPGTTCAAVEADQQTGRWTCTATSAPSPTP